jgi:hypothetical protein
MIYFPFLRGKLNELMALRSLAASITERGNVMPIIEPVKGNPNTRISLDKYIENSMPFLFVCNPSNGEFETQGERLFTTLISDILLEYDNWTPALQVQGDSTPEQVSSFLERYSEYSVAIIYWGLPVNPQVQRLLANESVRWHIFIGNRVETNYIGQIDAARRVMMSDRFNRQVRNADYPEIELFSDMNTLEGNPTRLNFGDFSMVGDYYAETGGPAYAVALHHIHLRTGTGPLYISHFISDRTETTADRAGKTLEAVDKLVAALDRLMPNTTQACAEYREIAADRTDRGLGYMKRLAIAHHLEVMLTSGIQLDRALTAI